MTRPAGKRGAAAGQDAPSPRCIVWLAPPAARAPDAAVPQALLTALARCGVDAVMAADGARVMRELAAASTLAVVVVEPEQQPLLGDLRAAVTHYYPATRFWQYTRYSGGRPRVSPMGLGLPGPPGTPGTHQPAPTTAPPTAPPHAGNGRSARPDAGASSAGPALDDAEEGEQGDGRREGAPPLASLTAEELAMLLGPDES